jgi:hypothetical protein
MRRTVSGLGSLAAIAALGLFAAFAADPAVSTSKTASKSKAKTKAPVAAKAPPAADSTATPADPAAKSEAAPPTPVYYAPAPKEGEVLRAKDFPMGVTALGKTADSIPKQRVRISVEQVPPTPPTPLPNLPPVSLDGVTVRPVEITAPPAPVDEFTQALARARRAEFIARTTVSQDKGQWSPTSAYPEGDPTKPYPWNPSTFSTPIWSQTWATVSTWPPAQDLRNWSPVRWTAPPFDPVWLPLDSWDRNLELKAAP